MNQTEEQPTIVCLNYCRTDPDSDYCLTCGRPPVPVTGINSVPVAAGNIVTIVELPPLT